jgi:hypothetical protein
MLLTPELPPSRRVVALGTIECRTVHAVCLHVTLQGTGQEIVHNDVGLQVINPCIFGCLW